MRRVAHLCAGLALALVTTTSLAPLEGGAPTGSDLRGATRQASGTGTLVMAEDGSWVPRSYYASSGAATGPGPGSRTAPSRTQESTRVHGSFIIDLAPGLDPHTAAAEIARDYGGEVEFVYDEVVGGFAFKGPDDARERMAHDPRIRTVEADYEAHLVGHSLPLERTAIRAPQAWNVSQGAGAVVAFIDTGVNASHPQLAGRVLGQDGSCVGESGAGAGGDTYGHGTTVAGHIFGHYGVLPAAAGYAVKVFPNGSSSTTYAMIICGINLVKSWASARGIQAANLSLSGTADSSSLRTAVTQLRDAGVVVVAAAGNSGGSVQYPAAYPEAVAVSALDASNSALASFSSRGSQIDMAAPGQSLLSLTINGCCASASGTSFAAPQVAAAAALVKSRQPTLPVSEVIATVQKSGFCPPGATAGLNSDGGNCGSPRSGDNDGYGEPALNLEGAAKGVDAIPTASFSSPTAGQVINNATFSKIRVAASDDDTPSSALDVDIDVASGGFQQAQYNAGASACPVAQTCHELAWPTGVPDGPVTIVARATEPGGGSVTTVVNASVDNVNDPPTVSWELPAAGAVVGSPVFVRVAAADDRGVTSVKVLEGTEEKATLSPNGASYEGWIELPDASHTLTAAAFDGANTSATERTFTVTSIVHQQTFDSTGAWNNGWYETNSTRWHPTAACAAGAPSPPFAYFGNDSSCLFATSSNGYLYSPQLTGLSGSKVRLTFDSKELVESCSGCTRDRRYVQVNYGSGWQTVYYQHAGTNRGSGQWEPREFVLNPCAGRVQIRFFFDPRSSTSNNHFGWGIDSVTVSRTSEALSC